MTIPAAASDNASMLRVANVTARAGALRVRSVTARAGTLRVANIAARTAVLMAAWAAVDFLPKLRPRCVPWILGTIALVSGEAAATKTGGNFGALALIAAISAGSADSLAVGWIVAALGTLGFEPLALAWGTDIWGLIGYPATLLAGLLLGLNRRDHRLRAEQSAVLLAK